MCAGSHQLSNNPSARFVSNTTAFFHVGDPFWPREWSWIATLSNRVIISCDTWLNTVLDLWLWAMFEEVGSFASKYLKALCTFLKSVLLLPNLTKDFSVQKARFTRGFTLRISLHILRCPIRPPISRSVSSLPTKEMVPAKQDKLS